MKALLFFPLAYIIGVEMFPVVALYLVLFMVTVIAIKQIQRSRQRRVIPVTIPVRALPVTSHP
jgi:hypothetical protein